jgi:predicted GNAT family N-acyltransferase
MNDDPIRIVPVDLVGDPLRDRIFRLRAEVWAAEVPQGMVAFPERSWTDAHDLHAYHWAGVRNGELVAAARLCVHDHLEDTPSALSWMRLGVQVPSPIASLGRLVVHRSARGRGVGRSLDTVRMLAAAKLGAVVLAGTARPTRVLALKSLGFTVIGPGQRHEASDPLAKLPPPILMLFAANAAGSGPAIPERY